MKKRYKLTTVLIAAIVAALLLAGAAVAAMQSELLKNLFPDGAPLEAEGLLIQDALSTEQEGVKLTIGEHLYDGRNFHLNWTVESTRDDTVFYTVNYQLRYPDGTPIDISRWSGRRSSSDQSRGALTALNLTLDGKTSPKRFSGYTSNGFMADEMPTKPWIYTLVVNVYTTDLTPVVGKHPQMLSEEECVEYSKNRQLPIGGGQSSSIEHYPEFLALYDEWGGEYWFDPQPRIDAQNRCGLLNHVASLSMPILMDPGAVKGAKVARLKQPTTLTFKDISVRFKSFEVDLSGIHTEFYIPTAQLRDDHMDLFSDFLILGPDGELLNDAFMGMSASFMPDEEVDGVPCMEIVQGGGSMSIRPTELTFINLPAAVRPTPRGMRFTPEESLAYVLAHPEERDEATLTLTIE